MQWADPMVEAMPHGPTHYSGTSQDDWVLWLVAWALCMALWWVAMEAIERWPEGEE